MLVLLVILTALAALSLAMRRHARMLMGAPFSSRRSLTLRIVGWALLVVALCLAVVAWGVGLGLTIYVALFTLCMIATALFYTFIGQRKRG